MTFHPGFAKIMEAVDVKDKSILDIGYQTNTHVGGTVEDWYRKRGAKSYSALDLVEKNGAVYADLNYPVNSPQVDIVCNNGTSEHLFNQSQVFKTIHDLAKETMVHCLPCSPWINHGFFNYNPTLFLDLAEANNYTLVSMAFHNRWGDGGEVSEFSNEAYIKAIAKTLSRGRGDVFISVVLLKGRGEFNFPTQGVYRDRVKPCPGTV